MAAPNIQLATRACILNDGSSRMNYIMGLHRGGAECPARFDNSGQCENILNILTAIKKAFP